MKMQELILTCMYAEAGQTITQIIDSSFAVFLKKELQNIRYHADNESLLISGGMTCT